MEIDFAIGLAGAVIGFGGGFITAAAIAISKVADTREEIDALNAIVLRQTSQLAGYRAADQRRQQQRKAALAKAQEVNAARNAAKVAKA